MVLLHLFCWQRATSPCISADHTDRKAPLKTPESMRLLTTVRHGPQSPITFHSSKHDTQNHPQHPSRTIYLYQARPNAIHSLNYHLDRTMPRSPRLPSLARLHCLHGSETVYPLHQTRREQPRQPPPQFLVFRVPQELAERLFCGMRGALSVPWLVVGLLRLLAPWPS